MPTCVRSVAFSSRSRRTSSIISSKLSPAWGATLSASDATLPKKDDMKG
jgi:hypothetical protein